ncbi:MULTISPECIES: phosphatase PAP2 family protein [Alphaproteobacteria]|uniref:Phosphatase PAP2 family protein n=2 Tax=Alphaproteobacteria TaxID=28211 RepID=A0A512HFU0_9HYPH|nr:MULTISPECIES: phosphatase PAP2 family protein [Alphaproteobacteria]GEO84250.1 phosphatase PAP2 family protein [Ciceribacter naphthalenivorans]GLR24786.1 phosphatase PAP2 family protein [Ciceribacter naphthalenivorans]GLT07642.1 phosphatase PAP2 family protein [Sphingomonas psychrolutea]
MIWKRSSGSLSFYVGGAALAALLAGFGMIADEVSEGETMGIDQAVLLALRTPGDPTDPIGPAWLEEAARDITALGSFSVLTILITVIVIHLFLVKRARTGWFLIVCVLGGTLISTILKSLFDRPRPDLTGVARVFTASFPSGHATISAVVYLTLGALLAEMAETRGQKILYLGAAVFLTVIVGLSRIYLGVHYPTDVLAGWSIGAGWALGCALVAHLYRQKTSARAQSTNDK